MPSIDRSPLAALAGLILLVAAALAPPAAAAAEAHAPAVPPTWRSAPIWGADVRSLVIHPTEPDTLLAGTSSGQVFLSTDGGEQWRSAGQYLPFPGWVVSALTFDPNRPGRLWAGLRGVWGDGLVSVSDDLGATWLPRVGDLPDLPVYSLAIPPGQAPGAEGKLYAGTLDGVWGTEDGGETWRKLSGAIPEMAKVASLHVPADEPGTVIAGTWRRAYKSDDGGRTWRGVFEGMYLDSEVFELVATGRPGELWAPTCNWVYQSLDGGDSWRRFVNGLDERRVTSFDALAWGRLLSGTVAGLYASDDGGKTWKRTTAPELSVAALAHHPARPARVFLGTEGGGVWVSHDGGDTVRPSSVGMTNLRVADVAAAGGELLLAVNHAGSASGIWVSRDGGRSFAERSEGVPTVLALAAVELPEVGGTSMVRAWAATERGLYERREGRWTRLDGFGEARVEEVIARDGRVVARTRDGVWELQRGSDGAELWAKTAYHHGPPRSAALRGGELWVTDAAGLYRVADGANHTVAAPYAAGRVAAAGARLLYTGADGAWSRGGISEPWVPLADGPVSVLPTGDERHPALLVQDGQVRLVRFLAADGSPGVGPGFGQTDLHLPIPARFVEAAVFHDGRLHLATSGFGLLSTDLPPPEPALEAP